MNAITIPEQGSLSLPQVERIRASLPPLSGRYPTTSDEAEATKAAVTALSRPADERWVAQRIFTLLSHYFVTESHPEAMKAVAKDWTAEMADCPQWAIEAAAKWWLSRDNPKRRNKPMPGDISDRAHREMAMIKFARQQVEFFERYGDAPPAFVSERKIG